MKRPTLWIVTMVVLFFEAGSSCLGSTPSRDGRAAQQDINVPKLVPPKRFEPNQTPQGQTPPQLTPQQVEQMRQRTRERIRQRALERRDRMMDANGLPRDVNALTPIDRPIRPQLSQAELYQQQMQAIDRHLAGEETKHRDRLGRLARIRELAQGLGDTESISRVDRLSELEKQMYEMRMQRMTRRRERIVESSAKPAPARDKNQPGPE